MELADAEGLDAISMRRIAGKLESSATSLYSYVSSKDDLYELIVDAVIGDIRLPSLTGEWRTDLRAVARNTHAALRRHRWMVLVGIQPGLGPKTQRYGQTALGALAGLNLDLRTCTNILATLNNYLFGVVHREVAWEQARQRSGLSSRQWTARQRRYLEQVVDQDPDVAQHVEARLELAGDATFDFGLECFLDGVAALIARARGDASAG
jgi:AcrR family transcriptional regulator